MVKYTEDNEEWNKNWREREEAHYIHWTRDDPQNQIQLAFRNHWLLFNEFMKNPLFGGGNRALEVGCGRGSLSAYFSDAGYHCTLLDRSEEVVELARDIFESKGLEGRFMVGDAYALDLPDSSIDVVFSIGVFEHFDDIETPILEQVRVLDHGGLFIAYIVPEYTDNVQKSYSWINTLLKGYAAAAKETLGFVTPKEDVFRSDRGSDRYLPYLEKAGLLGISASGVYPLPMISHSIEFPFSLMPEDSERAVVEVFAEMLKNNTEFPHPWMCEEGYGNAFVVWGYKP